MNSFDVTSSIINKDVKSILNLASKVIISNSREHLGVYI
jgi:hypothetical protein